MGDRLGRAAGARLRFAVWVFAVVVPIGAGVARLWLGEPGSAGQRAMSLVQLAGVVVMVVLLKTTPPDAIKLGRGTSIVLIGLGASVIWGTADAGGQLWLTLAIAAFVAIMSVATSNEIARLSSPWWGVAMWWLPVMASANGRVQRGGGDDHLIALAASMPMFLIGAVIGGLGAAARARVRWWMVAVFLLACAVAIVVV